ncbi:MAG: hypothetical protein WD751_10145 [Anaerolineales bacterium]
MLRCGDAVLQEGDEILALVDDDSRTIVAELLGRPGNADVAPDRSADK